jgi:glucose-6-phosphate-specific signal transduction histidine kinase
MRRWTSLAKPWRVLAEPRVWLIASAAWSVIGLFLATQLAFRSAAAGRGWDWSLSLEVAISMALWALLTPFIVVLADVIPVHKSDWKKALGVHLALALASAAVDAALTTQLIEPLLGLRPETFAQRFSSQTFACTASYAVIVAVRQAMNAHRLATQRQLEGLALEAELANAQLHALRMQLQPHFLFNALNTVSSLVRVGEPHRAVSTLAELGSFLKHVLEHEARQLMTVEDELEALQRYLRIVQVRFEDRLKTNIEVDSQALPALVPSLILQPLVENAVHHGVGTKPGTGTICIRIRKEALTLSIEVSDDGLGFPAPRNSGIGLRNTRSRLQRLYPEQHCFEVTSNETMGTRAVLRIPFHIPPHSTQTSHFHNERGENRR